jgi:hypothetical protein
MTQVHCHQARAHGAACSATPVGAAGRCQARRDSAMADVGPHRLAARVFAEMEPSAAAAGTEASAWTEAGPLTPAVSNWDAPEMQVARVLREKAVSVDAESLAMTALLRSIRQVPGTGARLAPGQCQALIAEAALDRQAAAGRVPPTCQLWRLCAAECAHGLQRGYPQPIVRHPEPPQRWRARKSRFAGSGLNCRSPWERLVGAWA